MDGRRTSFATTFHNNKTNKHVFEHFYKIFENK